MKNIEQLNQITASQIVSQVRDFLPSGESMIRSIPIKHIFLGGQSFTRGPISFVEDYEFASNGGRYRRIYCNGRHRTENEHHISTVFIGEKATIEHLAGEEGGNAQKLADKVHIPQSEGDTWLTRQQMQVQEHEEVYFLIRKTSFVPQLINSVNLFGQEVLLRLYEDMVHPEGGYSALIMAKDGGRTDIQDNAGNPLGKGILISNSPRIHKNDRKRWVTGGKI